MAFDKKNYDIKYNNDNIKKMFVRFNMKLDEDIKLYDAICDHCLLNGIAKSQYFKELAKKDLFKDDKKD